MFSSVLQAVCSLHADCFEFTLTPLIFSFFHQIGVGCTTESALACSNLQTGGKNYVLEGEKWQCQDRVWKNEIYRSLIQSFKSKHWKCSIKNNSNSNWQLQVFTHSMVSKSRSAFPQLPPSPCLHLPLSLPFLCHPPQEFLAFQSLRPWLPPWHLCPMASRVMSTRSTEQSEVH